MNWNSVVEKLGPGLLRYFMGSFPRHIADELVQETVIRLVRKVESDQFDPAQGKVSLEIVFSP
jgi:DNA-directed RNA polymerase specialized sigma24 family protein